MPPVPLRLTAAPGAAGGRDGGIGRAGRRAAATPARHALGLALLAAMALPAAVVAAPPARLRDTGLHIDASGEVQTGGLIAFTPQYPLWSDGTHKRRWLYLPPGRAIDAADPDAWKFPRGTRLWKEFAYGTRVETRYIALGEDGRWTYASYVWTADGSDAVLAPARGLPRLPVADAPEGRYAIPSHDDCLTCHAGARTPVLGFSALQLGELLPELVRRGLIRRGPPAWREAAPAIAAATDTERAARGYLHANCGHCHHEAGAPVPLVLAQRVGGMAAPSPASLTTALRRMATRDPLRQMPPLGTRLVDPQGLATVQAWLDETFPSAFRPTPHNEPKEPRP